MQESLGHGRSPIPYQFVNLIRGFMKLVYWMYNGPAHLGTLRTATSFKNVHAIMHAPLGDDYFNVMRSMLERERDFTPVTASIVDRHVLARGSQEKVIENVIRKDKEERPDLILLTPTCTSSILQEDLQNFADQAALHSQADIILADVNHYRVNEFQAADRTLEQVIRFYLEKEKLIGGGKPQLRSEKPSVNILGMFTLGFHHQHDCRELKRLFYECGIEVNLILPEGGSVHDIKKLPQAWFNVVPYREIGLMAAQYLEKEYDMPYIGIAPMGILETSSFLHNIDKILKKQYEKMGLSVVALPYSQSETGTPGASHGQSPRAGTESSMERPGVAPGPTQHRTRGSSTNHVLNGKDEQGNISEAYSVFYGIDQKPNSTKLETAGHVPFDFEAYIERQTKFVSQAAWFSRSIDCQNLTGKKAVVFGDATHAAAMTKILAREMGIRVSCAGTYCKHDADWFREQVAGYADSVLITDDHTQVSDMITRIQPNCLFGTQMERHIGKRLGIPCGVISSPSHVQNFGLGYRPFFGYEGTNQIADLVYNSFTLGMEDHLLEIFGGHDTKTVVEQTLGVETRASVAPMESNMNSMTFGQATEDSTQGEANRLDELKTVLSGRLTTAKSFQNEKASWSNEALKELSKVPGFVRNKVKQNVEFYASQAGLASITPEVMYAAKEANG